jgi:hypothetical protein
MRPTLNVEQNNPRLIQTFHRCLASLTLPSQLAYVTELYCRRDRTRNTEMDDIDWTASGQLSTLLMTVEAISTLPHTGTQHVDACTSSCIVSN